MEQKHFSVGDAVSWGFKIFWNQIKFFLLVGLIFIGTYYAALVLSGLFKSLLMSGDSPLMLVVVGVLCLVIFIFSVWLMLGLMKIMLNIYDFGKAEFKTLFSQGHLIAPFMGASFLFSLLVAIGLVFFIISRIGLVFFIITGIYLCCRYFFFYYILVDQQLGVIGAFQESSRLTEGARWKILGLLVVCALINLHITDMVPPLLMPISLLAIVYAYRKQQEYALQLSIIRNEDTMVS